MCLLEIFETWEGPLEVLRQIEDPLRDLYYLVFTSPRDANQTGDCVCRDQLGLAELLANL